MDRFRIKRPRFGNKRKSKDKNIIVCAADNSPNNDGDAKVTNKKRRNADVNDTRRNKLAPRHENTSLVTRDQLKERTKKCEPPLSDLPIADNAQPNAAKTDDDEKEKGDKHETITPRRLVKKLPRPSSTSLNHMISLQQIISKQPGEMDVSEKLNVVKSLPTTPIAHNTIDNSNKEVNVTKKSKLKAITRGGRIPVATPTKANRHSLNSSIPRLKIEPEMLGSKNTNNNNKKTKKYVSTPELNSTKKTQVDNKIPKSIKSKTLPKTPSRPNTRSSSKSSITAKSSASSVISENSKECSEILKCKSISKSVKDLLARKRPKSSSPIKRNTLDTPVSRKSDPGTVGWRALASDRLKSHISKGKTTTAHVKRPISPLALTLEKSYSPSESSTFTAIKPETPTLCVNGKKSPVNMITDINNLHSSSAESFTKKGNLVGKKPKAKGILHNTMSSRNDLRSHHKEPIHRINEAVDGLNSILDKLTSNCVRDDNSLNSSTCSLYSEFSERSNSVPDVFDRIPSHRTSGSNTTPRSRNLSSDRLQHNWNRNRSFFLRCTELRRKQHRQEWENNRLRGMTDRFSPFAQRDNVIRKLTLDLEDAKRIIKMQEDEILSLRESIEMARESAIEEECGKVEAEIKRVRAENDSKHLEETVKQLRNSIEELKRSREKLNEKLKTKDLKADKQLSENCHLQNGEILRSSKEYRSPCKSDEEDDDIPMFDSRHHGESNSEWSVSKSLHGSNPVVTSSNTNKEMTSLTEKVDLTSTKLEKNFYKFNWIHLILLTESVINSPSINQYQIGVIKSFFNAVFSTS